MKKQHKPLKSLKKTVKINLKDTRTCLYCGEDTFIGTVEAEVLVTIDESGRLIAEVQKDSLNHVICSNCLKPLDRDLYTNGWDYLKDKKGNYV